MGNDSKTKNPKVAEARKRTPDCRSGGSVILNGAGRNAAANNIGKHRSATLESLIAIFFVNHIE